MLDQVAEALVEALVEDAEEAVKDSSGVTAEEARGRLAKPRVPSGPRA